MGMWTEPLLLQDLLGTAPERVMTRSSWRTDPFRGNLGALWMKPRVAIHAPTLAQNPPDHAQEPSCLLPSPSTLVGRTPHNLSIPFSPSQPHATSAMLGHLLIDGSLANNLTNWPRMPRPLCGVHCASPTPPRDVGKVDVSRTVGWHWVGSICNTCDKHRRNPASWVLAEFSTAHGRTALNWKLARADAQCSNNSHAD